MPTERPRPGSPDFLDSPEAIIEFMETTTSRHRPTGGGCICGWSDDPLPGGNRITHADHATAALQLELAERLPSTTFDTDGTVYNWPDLVDDLYQQVDRAASAQDERHYGDALLRQTAAQMKEAAEYIDQWYTEKYPGPDSYRVSAHRSGTIWELHIDRLGVTQVLRADDAEAMIRDYLAVMGGNSSAELRITWHPTGTTTVHRKDEPDTMPPPLDTADAKRLELDAYYPDFQTTFDASDQFWKLERSQDSAEPSSKSWRAFNHGDWDQAMELLDAWKEELKPVHRRNTANGTKVRRIRIVETPFTPYIQWELELLWRRDAVTGGIRTLDAVYLDGLEPDGTLLPDLNITDTCAYHVIYDEHGVISHVWKYTDPGIVNPWRDLTRRLWDRGTAMNLYYKDHVQGLPAPKPAEQLPDDYLEQHGRPRQGIS